MDVATPNAPVFQPKELTFFHSWEIKKHLELCPFLEIPLSFDYKACFDEAMAVMELFVDHRNYLPEEERGPRWKSVCLRGLDGQTDKTLYHADYGIRETPNYQLTKAAQLCPKTMSFLSTITDLDRCERIRFMLLEPGAKIHVHTDAPNDRSVVALNIALNMPEGCEFFINTREDGSHSPWTEKIPFRDGTGFLINVANYHYVENRSQEPRIHIIVHGPLKWSESQLLQWARRQNQVHDEKQLVSRLTVRYAQQNVEFKRDLIEEWVKFAVETDELLSHMRLVILNPSSFSPELTEENTHRITAASLYPIKAEFIAENELDSYLQKIPHHDDRMVVVLGAGSYIPNFYEFFYELCTLIGKMKEDDVPVVGHLLHFPEELPSLHEQFVVLNTPLWRKAGSPKFGDIYLAEAQEFAPFVADTHHVHDNYTPRALHPSDTSPVQGKGRFGSSLLSRFLQMGWTVRNVPSVVREQKQYSYFKKNKSKELSQIRRDIEQKFESAKNQIYCFNNEPLHVVQIPNFKPSSFLMVASGFKPASLSHQYGTPDSKYQFYDINDKALKYQQALSRVSDRQALLKTIESFDPSPRMKSNANEYLHLVLKQSFDGNEDLLWKTLKRFSKARFQSLDFVSNPLEIIKDLPSDGQCLFWHSNAWSNNFIYFLMSQEQIELRYSQLIDAIKTKLNAQAWRHAYHREVLFGRSLTDIQMVMTDGMMQGSLRPELYTLIN